MMVENFINDEKHGSLGPTIKCFSKTKKKVQTIDLSWQQ